MSGTATQSAILQAAMGYAARGWQVLPLIARGKRPILTEWQKKASTSEDQIAEWWEKWPEANVGIKFGSESNLVDLECDDQEQEDALAALFGGEFPVTPTFTSSRGKHRLFRWNQDLPCARDKAVVYVGGVGFRTGGGSSGAQSVFPPSIHPSGDVYRWIISPDEADVAEIPETVIARIANHEGGLFGQVQPGQAKPPEHWQGIIEGGAAAGHRNETAASLIGRLLLMVGNVFDAQAIQTMWDMVQLWNRSNSPPMESVELERTFKSILQRERLRRANDQSRTLTETVKPWAAEMAQIRHEWRLVIVESDPREYKLWSPLWSPKIPHGYIVLNSAQYLDWGQIRRQALEQADSYVAGNLSKIWNGDKEGEALARKLIDSATYERAPIDDDRILRTAEALLDMFSRLSVLRDGESPLSMRAFRMQTGDIAVQFNRIVDNFGQMGWTQKDSRRDLSVLLRRLGVDDISLGAGGERRRYKHFPLEMQRKLQEMVDR